jgi:5-carboxymethyl-2-hydroxymuconate isomerase
MPHLTLEYTDNIAVEIQPLLARLHEGGAATRAINLKGIKNRAIKPSQCRIADGNPNHAFVHAGFLTRQGRPIEFQKEATRRVMQVSKDVIGHRFESGHLSLKPNLG